MWSLPDIKQMNARKASSQSHFRDQLAHPEENECDHCGNTATCASPYYDIFSDDIAGVSLSCEEHEGSIDEGFFECESCGRRMIENITWERYETNGICLKCAAEKHFSNPDSWINPAEVEEIVYEKGKDLFRDGKLNVFAAPHVLGVEQPIPKGFKFVSNAEFDSMSGNRISGFHFEERIRALKSPFTLVLDAGYQFAVSIGIYQRIPTDGEIVQETVAAARAALTDTRA